MMFPFLVTFSCLLFLTCCKMVVFVTFLFIVFNFVAKWWYLSTDQEDEGFEAEESTFNGDPGEWWDYC